MLCSIQDGNLMDPTGRTFYTWLARFDQLDLRFQKKSEFQGRFFLCKKFDGKKECRGIVVYLDESVNFLEYATAFMSITK